VRGAFVTGLQTLRVGRLPYLNALPFRAGFRGPEPRWATAPPRRLGELAAAGELDAALVASRDALALGPAFRPLLDLGIASRGPVASVLLISRLPLGRLGGARIALSEESRTSRALLRILLAERLGRDAVQFVSECSQADARLWIGDRALLALARAEGLHVIDLGTEWTLRTGLPFVWARWIVRADVPAARARELGEALAAALDREPPMHRRDLPMHLSPAIARAYLSRFQYRLGPSELDGLERFQMELRSHDLLDPPARSRPLGSAA
jgi:chorismate dehydratase